MRFSSHSRFGGWRAAFLLVAVACATPQNAQAGCGDHVIIVKESPATDRHSVSGGEEEGRPHAPVPPPCRGPDCSQSPTRNAPPIAPVAPAGPSVSVKALAPSAGPVDGADSPRASLHPTTTSSRPIKRATSVFHPPRD